jgi:NTP pyrophosphatase (non-canonical NTP hydrolase)
LTYLSEFEARAKQAKWTNEVNVLQLRTLLTGEAKEVSELANKNDGEELRKALVDRFGRRPHQYFADLLEVMRGENET